MRFSRRDFEIVVNEKVGNNDEIDVRKALNLFKK